MRRFVKWPKYVRIQRQRRVLNQRLKVGGAGGSTGAVMAAVAWADNAAAGASACSCLCVEVVPAAAACSFRKSACTANQAAMAALPHAGCEQPGMPARLSAIKWRGQQGQAASRLAVAALERTIGFSAVEQALLVACSHARASCDGCSGAGMQLTFARTRGSCQLGSLQFD